VFFFTGRQGKHAGLSRYIPVHQIHDSLETSQLNILLPVYCLTGCDTISSFWGHSKKAVYRLVIQKSDAFQDLLQLGTNLVGWRKLLLGRYTLPTGLFMAEALNGQDKW